MSSEGDEEVLGAFDSVHFTVGTVRTVENRTQPAGEHARDPSDPLAVNP